MANLHIKVKFARTIACVALATGVGAGFPAAFAYAQESDGADAVLALDESGLPVVQAGSVIEEGGTYQLEPYTSNGTLTIATTDPVTIVGSGITSGKSDYFTIDCAVAGVNLTLRDVRIDNATECNCSALRFTGTGNVLTIEGENSLQQCYNNSGDLAIVYVPSGGNLTIQGDGTLYMYKHSYGCSAIGADGVGASGDIKISGGTLRILAMNGGAAIGGEQGGSVTIDGGDVAMYVRTRTTGLLGSSVSVTGGTVSIGAASDAGCVYCDSLLVTGGNLNADPSTVVAASTGGLTRYDLDLSAFDWFDGTCEVLVDGVPYYSGALSECTFSQAAINQGDWSSIPSNWIAGDGSTLTLYLSGRNHEITVNGETLYLTFDGEGFELGEAPDEGDEGSDEGDSGEQPGGEEADNPDGSDSPDNPGDEGEDSDNPDNPGDEGENPSGSDDPGDSDDEGDENVASGEGDEGPNDLDDSVEPGDANDEGIVAEDDSDDQAGADASEVGDELAETLPATADASTQTAALATVAAGAAASVALGAFAARRRDS